MKTPFVLLAVLFIQAEAFTVKEQRYFNFVIMNNKINKIANNVTTYLESVNDDVYQLALNFHANMSEIREKYGPMSYDYYDRKYSRLAHEFATKMSLSRDCAGYVADVLANNEKYQNITSELLDSILHYFKIEYEKIYAKMIDIRKALTEEEVDAFKCSTTFTGGDKDDHWNCAESAYTSITIIQTNAFIDMKRLYNEFIVMKDAALNSLHQRLKDELILDFYDNDASRQRWLETFCSYKPSSTR